MNSWIVMCVIFVACYGPVVADRLNGWPGMVAALITGAAIAALTQIIIREKKP